MQQQERLRYELHASGIGHLDTGGSERYKDAQIHALKNPEPRPEVYRKKNRPLVKLGQITLILGLGLVLFNQTAYWPLIGIGTVLIILGYIGTKTVRMVPVAPKLEAAWKTVSYDEYGKHVPQHPLVYGKTVPEPAREKAEELRARLPGVQLDVEYLDQDPFLIASYKGERYYIAVWDESGFVG